MLLVTAASCSKDDVVSKSNAADITAFTVDGAAWNINGTDITYTYPAETQEGQLTPVITLSPGATVTPASGTAQNFFTAQGVTYTVTAEDGATKKIYTAKADIAVVASGTTGDCTWTLTGIAPNCTLTISGNGAMGNYYYCGASPWYADRNDIKTAVIQNGVTAIGEVAFCECTVLTSVTIGNSVTTISDGAFHSCTGLTSVSIPNSVTTIGVIAFGYCYDLTEVSIPNSVTTIGDYAFTECFSLTEVINMSATPQNISSLVFDGVTLNSLTLKVPASAVAAYQAAPVWQDFGTITGI
ncbi:MAG: leucine-rich repeat protein [Prevotellaceae bacterium]|nr:leucine-rich repeat protein [Prevotellaceae bacterium]